MSSTTVVGAQPAEKMRYLSELMVFQDLTAREMEDLNRITTMSTVQKGKVFYRPEEPGEVLFILKEGRVQLYRISPEGKKLVITTLGDHTLFGEMALLGTKMHNTFAEAIEDCLICVMSRTDLERLILSKPQVALRLLEITGSGCAMQKNGWRVWPSRVSRPGWPACFCAWPRSGPATK